MPSLKETTYHYKAAVYTDKAMRIIQAAAETFVPGYFLDFHTSGTASAWRDANGEVCFRYGRYVPSFHCVTKNIASALMRLRGGNMEDTPDVIAAKTNEVLVDKIPFRRDEIGLLALLLRGRKLEFLKKVFGAERVSSMVGYPNNPIAAARREILISEYFKSRDERLKSLDAYNAGYNKRIRALLQVSVPGTTYRERARLEDERRHGWEALQAKTYAAQMAQKEELDRM